MTGDTAANRLGAHLRARRGPSRRPRRGLISPQQAGLPPGGTRRVPGLRREEVALLAGISADYYLRLERGRDSHPSAQVLESLTRVLQLDEVEAEYLVSLGNPPSRRYRQPRAARVPARLTHLLNALEVPAFLENRYFDV